MIVCPKCRSENVKKEETDNVSGGAITAGAGAGAVAGATIGSLFLPVVGTAIGGLLGAIVGGGQVIRVANKIADNHGRIDYICCECGHNFHIWK